MTLYPTVAILIAAFALLGFTAWRRRRRRTIDVPLIDPFIIQLFAVLVVVLMVIHLLKLWGIGPGAPRSPGF